MRVHEGIGIHLGGGVVVGKRAEIPPHDPWEIPPAPCLGLRGMAPLMGQAVRRTPVLGKEDGRGVGRHAEVYAPRHLHEQAGNPMAEVDRARPVLRHGDDLLHRRMTRSRGEAVRVCANTP